MAETIATIVDKQNEVEREDIEVTKKKSEEDARITIVCITDKGKEFVEKTNEEIVNYFLKGFEKLEDEDESFLLESLDFPEVVEL